MTAQTTILRDLLAGQSTADSICGRTGLHPGVAEATLFRLHRQGLLLCLEISGLRVWRLTEKTRQSLGDAAVKATIPIMQHPVMSLPE